MEILRVENLTKVYGKGENEVRALDGVSFSVEKGEFVAVIGPSGSGKSTLLHILGGVDRPTSGRVLMDGKDVYAQNEEQLAIFRRRQVGLIYQFYNLIPVLNVTENITLPVLMDGQKVNQNRLAELMTTLKLTGRENHLPNQLSGGQQQRVSIGRALMNAPAVVLADEPTGNLDSKNSKEIVDLLKISNEKYGQTLLVITHDESIALQADRILSIEDGENHERRGDPQMNVFNKVTLASLKQNRTRTVVTIIGIMLSAAMICASTTFVASMQNFVLRYTVYKTGDWHGAVYDAAYKDYEDIGGSGKVASATYAQTLGYARINSANERKPYLYVLGGDAASGYFETMPVHLTAGELPKSSSEIILPEHLATNGKVSYKIGDTVTFEVGDRILDNKRLGQINPFFTYDSEIQAEVKNDEKARKHRGKDLHGRRHI